MKRKTGKFNALCGAVLLALALAGCGAPAGNEADAEKTAGNSGSQVTVEPGKEESPDGADKEQNAAGTDEAQTVVLNEDWLS